MYTAIDNRYDTMPYNRLGISGLKLSAVSLGLWHNFGKANADAHQATGLTSVCIFRFLRKEPCRQKTAANHATAP